MDTYSSPPLGERVVADTLIRNIGQLVTVAQQPIAGAIGPLQVLSQAAITVHQGIITWVGPDEDGQRFVPSEEAASDTFTVIDAQRAVVTPGFVDSHTHLIFAGNRAQEFHLRRAGVSYAKLLERGQGILSTLQATRAASAQLLTRLALARMDSLRQHGTTTVEIKTGYGLSVETEKTCLHIMNNLSTQAAQIQSSSGRIRVVPTFLGAHTLPPEYREQRATYVDLVVNEMLPAFSGMARFCDVFCEQGAFTLEESRRILTRAKELGYGLKIHADQLSPGGGARLAAELGATSADHLDHASDSDLDAMREAGVVATLLPGCSYTLRTPYPSARRLLERGLKVALATDFNPGTSYCENMQTMLGLAMSAMGMTLDEALIATTINGACALGLQDEIGSIEVGKRCELAFWSIHDYLEIGYHFGTNLVSSTLVLP